MMQLNSIWPEDKVNLPTDVSASETRYADGRETFFETSWRSGGYWIGEELIFHSKAKE